MAEINLNQRAVRLVEEMIELKDELSLKVKKIDDVTVIDGGVDAKGGFKAGEYFARVCLADLAEVEITQLQVDDYRLPAIEVTTDYPFLACLMSQYAGWKVSVGDYFTMASGPGRAVAAKEELFAEFSYQSQEKQAVLVLETDSYPTAEVINYLSESLQVEKENLYLLIAPTASIVGSIQINARIVETGMHKIMELGFDIKQIENGFGISPIAPVAEDDLAAIGRTNDAILYGGEAYYTVKGDDQELEELIDEIPACASKDYGKKFIELYQNYGNFYEIDPLLFSPAQVMINNLSSGRVFKAGQIEKDILFDSLLGIEE